MYTRNQTRVVMIGNVAVGGGNPIAIQSMTNTKTADVSATVSQIRRLEEAGCEIIRCTVPDKESAEALKKIKKQISLPLVADIHFDYRMAIAAVENGADKIRINPGNLGGKENLQKVVDVCKERHVPIRVGVNSGSVEPDLLEKYGRNAVSLTQSALRNVRYLEEMDFHDIVVSVKASDVETCVKSYELFSSEENHLDEIYPLHIGITEAGTVKDGSIKSALGFGILLHEKLGDTLRVSLTTDPVEEVIAAKKMLSFMNIRKFGVEIVSCPTCGRTQIDLIHLAEQAEKALAHIKTPIKVAVMGCIVNGPGEARECDFGIAGGKDVGLLFRKGEIIKKLPETELLKALVEEAEKYDR